LDLKTPRKQEDECWGASFKKQLSTQFEIQA